MLTAAVVGTGALAASGVATLTWWASRHMGAMRALAATTNQAVVRRGRDGRWQMAVGVNPAPDGMEAREVAPPVRWRERCHPLDLPALDRWLLEPAPAPLRFRLQGPDGELLLEATRKALPHAGDELLVWRDLTTSERLAKRVRRHEQVQRAIVDNLADIAVFVQPMSGGNYTALCLPHRFSDLFTATPVATGAEALPPFVPAMVESFAQLRERVLATPTHSAAVDREIGGRHLQILGTLLGDGTLEEADLLLVVRDLGPDAKRVNRLETAAFLSGGVVHDLNNVLSMLIMHAEMGRERVGTPAQAAVHFDRISTACQRATELTGLMRRYLRREDTDDQRPAPALRVGEAVEEAVNLLRPSISRGIRVYLELDRDVAIAAEAVHVHQVVSNLVLNAAQALAGHATPRIRVIVARAADAPGQVELTVEDNGPGMLPAVRERCFEPFFTTKSAGEGTGLGLAVVHGIVTEALGGTVSVEDAPGGGSRFRLRIPAVAWVEPPQRLAWSRVERLAEQRTA
ncbi:MAG TPA: HAMP domain-containing sensor histidine kinase [Gemmatimonadaceae bacterium]|nr:HAMP domain-containing sensor histidine kinase [Gemmatimonadaceae bacterium]